MVVRHEGFAWVKRDKEYVVGLLLIARLDEEYKEVRGSSFVELFAFVNERVLFNAFASQGKQKGK